MNRAAIILVLFASFTLISADAGKWMVENEFKNVTCLIAQMSIKTNFSYPATNNTMKNVMYEVPSDAKTDPASSCGEEKDTLKVTWGDGNNFELNFDLVNKTTYDLSTFIITLNASSLFNDSMANTTISIALNFNSTDSPFKIPGNFSYHCNREQMLNATTEVNNEKFIALSKVQFEAFKTDNTQKFSLAKDCDSNIKPDIVPIAVGLSLIALIVIVLIAFIVGRRRSQARGYLNIM